MSWEVKTMQSKTSFFNKTIFRKSVTRFWPLWFLYAAVWLFILPLLLAEGLRGGMTLLNLQLQVYSLASGASVTSGFLTGCVAAMAVWSFLYSARSAHGMACLPIRREGLFASVTLAGILPALVINLAVALLTLAVEAVFGLAHLPSLLTWLGANSLCLVFFYGFAVFCAQLTGNILVLPVVYVILNFTAVVVESIIHDLTRCFIFGAAVGGEYILTPLSPMLQLFTVCRAQPISELTGDYYTTLGYRYEGWGTLAIYAAVGVLFLAAALLLFRRRRIESAGDVVAVNVLKPVFKYCFTLGCALVLGWLSCSVLIGLPGNGMGGLRTLLALLACMLAGAFIGYFAAEMLIRKSFRVWRGRWAGFGVSALVIAALLFAAEFDLFGYETWTPDAAKVDRVILDAGGETLLLDDEESIKAVISLQESIVANKSHYEELYTEPPAAGWDCVYLRLYYYTGGRTVSRCYSLAYYTDRPDSYGDVLTLQNLMNTPQAIASRKATPFELTADNIISGAVESVLPAADCARLAGYEDAESFILGYYGELSEQEIAALSPERRQELLEDLILNYAVSYTPEYRGDPPAGQSVSSYTVDLTDLDTVLFYYTWALTAEEAAELYRDCIRPDMADQTIGKVWFITGESYRQSVYSATISIDARFLNPSPSDALVPNTSNSPGSDDYIYHYFYTVPTVDSLRTNLWLSAHGIEMLTLAQLYQ